MDEEDGDSGCTKTGQVINAVYETREGFMRGRVLMVSFLESRDLVDSESSETIRRAD
jgi:hypothetical protein